MTIKKTLLIVLLLGCVFLIITYLKLSADSITQETCTVKVIADVDKVDFKKFKNIKVSASTVYEGDLFKELLQGSNYRTSWEAEIEAPILYLDTLYGGVEIVKEGGGKQTQSLRLETDNDLLLTLRSINKNPEALVPEYLKNLGLENIVMDGISGQHPYAALVVAKLSDYINLNHTQPKVVFLPKQKLLDQKYNDEYGNRLYLLEYENKGKYNWTAHHNVTELIDTEDLQELKVSLKDSLSIDKSILIRARLFDIVIGDWDRHAKQWGWIIQKKDSLLYNAIPLPVDRDNAFFNVDGFINSLVTNKNITPHLQSFQPEIDNMEGLVYDFDVYFLQKTTLQQFLEQAQYIQTQLTDEKIKAAFKLWNKTLYDLEAENIIAKIKARRDRLIDTAKRFKSVLDNKPKLIKLLKGTDIDDVSNASIQCFEC